MYPRSRAPHSEPSSRYTTLSVTHPLQAVGDEGLKDSRHQQRDADDDEVHADDEAGVHAARAARHGPNERRTAVRSTSATRSLQDRRHGGDWHDAGATRRGFGASAGSLQEFRSSP